MAGSQGGPLQEAWLFPYLLKDAMVNAFDVTGVPCFDEVHEISDASADVLDP